MNIEAKELSKIYGSGESRVVALDKVNLEIASSDFISIMGPSGSGKSTLLHLLSGLDKPTSGSLTYDGKDIYRFNDKELSSFRRRRIGFIFQQFNLLPVLTAKENIIMPLLLDKKQPDEVYLNQLTDLLGIRERLTHLPHELSGGMRQRAALIRTLVLNPTLLLLDEPFSALDYQTRLKVADDIGTIIKQEEKTAILVTHDLSEAVSLANRVIVLSERPAQIAAVVPLEFEESLTPFERRAAPQFKDYFNIIWKELNHDE